jgi:hypothetical protein
MTDTNSLQLQQPSASETITISASQQSISPNGATITISGTTNAPNNTNMRITWSSPSVTAQSTTVVVSSQAFQKAISIQSNTTGSTQTWTITATDSTTNVVSNSLSITQAAPSPFAISTTATSIPLAGGQITFTGTGPYLNATLYIFVDGGAMGTTTSDSSGNFTFALSFPANTIAQTQTYIIDVSTTTSNV